VADCPSLPGCKIRGQTRDEAQNKIREAVLGYIAAVSNFVPDTVVHEVSEV